RNMRRLERRVNATPDGARMAKRNSGGKRGNPQTTNAAAGNGNQQTGGQGTGASSNDPMEQRVVAFAEQLGRIVGTVQAKTEGWMDRDALNKQIAGVRDSAAELLEQLSGGVANLTNSAAK